MKVSIGSTNKAKIAAVKDGFAQGDIVFLCLEVSSQVSPQPFSDDETMRGAINRAQNALYEGNTDIGIGLEGGVVETPQGLFLCNWGALTDGDITVVAGGARIQLPEELEIPLLNGMELGPLMERYSQNENIRQGEGAIGVLTNGHINRKEMFTHITKMLIGQYEYKRQRGINE
jgi:inosine/xanthosine triphosphatase